ncbi:MAG: hypothetical protein QXV17_10500 [Candidatus Micrarchaeaceae archaeon]
MKTHYYKRFTVTLSFFDVNIDRAFEVYERGVYFGLSLHGAVIHYFGYRYRRIENFIQELGLYDATTHRWIHVKSLVKIKALYESAKKGIEIYEFQVICLRPLGLTTLDEDFAGEVFLEVLSSTPFSLVSIYLSDIKWAYDNLGFEFYTYRDCYLVCPAILQVSVRGAVYEYDADVLVSNYSLFGKLKELCKKWVSLKSIAERRLK